MLDDAGWTRRHAAAPGRHASAQLRLRTAYAGGDIYGAGQCFWFVAVRAIGKLVLFRRLVKP
jgi:hypothetical protein